jgi:arylsulfatase A-like enzyme
MKTYLGVFLLTTLWACQPETKEKKTETKPNIVLIMADDLGYGNLGCYGDTVVQTPALDELATRGIRFTDYHSNGPVCTPTRAALLTGNYQQRSGLEGVIYVQGETRQLGLDTTTITLPELLQKNGYRTGIMGKWHLGYKPQFNPVHHGFDEFHGYVSGNVDYHSHYDNAGIYDWFHNLDSAYEEGYVTDLITEHSIDFIRKNKAQPFFLYIAHEAPHTPFQGRNDPAFRFPEKEFTYHGPVEDQDRAYREMIEVMDEGIGKVLDALQAEGVAENTLVIFCSDNGAEKFGNNGVLNGSKGGLLEGGHRVPAIVSWSGRIEPGETNQTLMSMDWLPTILAVTGTQAPAGVRFDGADLSEVLFNQQSLPERTLFWRYRDQKAARHNSWKLLINKNDTSLYQLENDLQETHNLAPAHPQVVHDLSLQLQDWEKTVGAKEEMITL